MTDVAAIRTALAAAIAGMATTPKINAKGYLSDSITPPWAAVQPDSIDYDVTFRRGYDEIALIVRVYASRSDDRAGQAFLDSLLVGSGATSVKTAIEADRTLGGVAETLRVTAMRNYGVYEVAGVAYLGAEFAVTVWAKGT